MPAGLLGRLGDGRSVSQLGVVSKVSPEGRGIWKLKWGGQRDLVWHLREQLGMLSVLYCLEHSHQREVSPAQNNQTSPNRNTVPMPWTNFSGSY